MCVAGRASLLSAGRSRTAQKQQGMTARDLRIAIIGGGTGGLTMALALRQRGMQADVEDRFGIRIPNDDRKRFVTLGDAVDFLRAAGAER